MRTLLSVYFGNKTIKPCVQLKLLTEKKIALKIDVKKLNTRVLGAYYWGGHGA